MNDKASRGQVWATKLAPARAADLPITFISVTSPSSVTTRALRIGLSSAGNFPFGGVLDEVAVYLVALDPARIKAHYCAGAGIAPESCL